MALTYGFLQTFKPNKQSPFIFHIGNTGIDPLYHSHMHSHIELIWVFEGNGYCKCDDREYPLTAGDIAVFNSYTIHSIYSSEKMRFYCFIIEPQFCKDNGIPISDIQFKELIRDQGLINCFDYAVKQYNDAHTSPCYETRVKIALLSLLVALREDFTDTVNSNQNTLTPALLQTKKAMHFIVSNWQNKITINDIVSAVNVSSAHLSRNFKQITGKTIVEFINTTKCEMAQSLLLSGLSVTEVSNMCGFDTPSYFAKTFKKYIGTSPKSHTIHSNNKTI